MLGRVAANFTFHGRFTITISTSLGALGGTVGHAFILDSVMVPVPLTGPSFHRCQILVLVANVTP